VLLDGKASLNGSSEAKGSEVKPSDLNGSPENSINYTLLVIKTSDWLYGPV
jgi:hypothetical protein